MNVRMSYGKRLAAALLAGVAVVAGLYGWWSAGGCIPWWIRRLSRRWRLRRFSWWRWRLLVASTAVGSVASTRGASPEEARDLATAVSLIAAAMGVLAAAAGAASTVRARSATAPFTVQQSHGEFSSDAGARQQNRFNEANTLQSNRYNATNSLQSNRYNDARNVQINRQNDFNSYSGSWGGYFLGLGFGAGLAIGASVAALPAAAVALSVAGVPTWLIKWHLLCVARRPVCRYRSPHRCGGPNHSAVVLDPLCGFGVIYDCDGAYYSPVGMAMPFRPPGGNPGNEPAVWSG